MLKPDKEASCRHDSGAARSAKAARRCHTASLGSGSQRSTDKALTDDLRRRLAIGGRIVGRRRLGEFAGLVTPDTILRWYRELIARSTGEHPVVRG